MGSVKRRDAGAAQSQETLRSGAFRHALWQSAITSVFGSKIAKEAGNAHEKNPFADLKVRSFQNLADADQTADLLNNIIGRNIGEANKGSSMDDLANIILDEFKNNGLFTASKDEKGIWNVSRTKISTEKYNQLYEKMGNLNLIMGWAHAKVIENLLNKCLRVREKLSSPI